MSPFMDLTGQKFGRLTAKKFICVDNKRTRLWLCECECGQKTTVRCSNLKNGNTKSCGCLRIRSSNYVSQVGIPGEVWKDIPGYTGRYQVSNMGRVKSLIRPNSSRKILQPSTKKDGHLHVVLSKNKKQTTYMVHSLVILTFVGPRPKGMECRHLDSNPKNNELSNLQYGTHKENMEDCSKHGGFPDRRGIKNVRAKLIPKQVISIRKLYDDNALLSNQDKLSQLQIANLFGISEYAVWAIVNRKTWKHLPNKEKK